jgi:hypothetical protein
VGTVDSLAWPIVSGVALAGIGGTFKWITTINRAFVTLTRVAEKLSEVTTAVTKLDERLDVHERVADARWHRLTAGLHARYLDPATDDRPAVPAPR